MKSPELQARLNKLQQQLDKQQYDQMTADVTQQASSVQLLLRGMAYFNVWAATPLPSAQAQAVE